MRPYLPTALLALLLVSSAARAATIQVTVRNFEFSPATVDIQVGDTVTWTNVSGTHSVTSDDGSSFSKEAQSAPWTFSHTFDAAGSFPYHCEVHPTMHGTVNVAPVVPCEPTSTALCLNNGRFRVEVSWRTASQSGDATAVPLDFAPDSGLFYFFGPSNIEMLVKVLNACVPALGNKYWVFFAATTNVEFTMTVTDTATGKFKIYRNALGTAALPVQDTNAFPTCP
jgi:plastocyanin